VPQLERGRIVWFFASDPQGHNPKKRAFVIVTSTEEIRPDQPFKGVAVTGTFRKPLDPNCVALPWAPTKHPRTGFRKECVAVCDWICEIHPGTELQIGGTVPGKQLLEILKKVDALAEG
jgi:hypothetical protein